MSRSTAVVLESAALIIDSRGLARGRFADGQGRQSVEGAIQSALALHGGDVRHHHRTYGEAVELTELQVVARGFRPPAGRQLLSAWSDEASEGAAVALLRRAAVEAASIE